jgi:pyruvate/2-oxoglutarate dehydrogenase complex dihydrolipoamide acyltransferase (E2) component
MVRFSSSSIHLADTQKLTLPALSPTMTEGTLVRWLVKEGLCIQKQFLCFLLYSGDRIKSGASLFEVETDKSVMSADAVEDGYLAKILVCCCRGCLVL